MLEQRPERFDEEIEAIKKTIQESGEEVQGVWVHDLTGAARIWPLKEAVLRRGPRKWRVNCENSLPDTAQNRID